MRGICAAALLTFSFGACGGGSGVGDVDARGGGGVPDPGSAAIPFSWPDTEPNDTPATAVPLGTSVNNGEATWFDGTAASGQLGGSDTEDYFVWKSSTQGGNFHAGPCWDGAAAPNLLDFYVYEVDSGQEGPMVASSTDTDPGCENMAAAADFTMQPNTVYLLELRAKPGSPQTLYAA